MAMMDYLVKMRGGAASPSRPHYRHVAWSWVGGLLGIAITGYIAQVSQSPLLMPPFGATCVLAFGVPDSPFAQPRNIIGGHVLSALVGLLFLYFCGPVWWAMALAVATAIAVMQLTRTVHPPAGADPLVIMIGLASWKFLITPVLLGSIILVCCGLIFNNLGVGRSYPKYWL